MKKGLFVIEENSLIARDVYRMRLAGDTSAVTNPGQFVNIALEGKFLRRPISVCDYDESSVTIIYRVVGEGTKQMSEMPVGQCLDLLTGLGNGFSAVSGRRSAVIGGGMGIAPLYALVKKLHDAVVILGAKTKEDLFLIDDFRRPGTEVHVVTEDGSLGSKGLVTDVLRGKNFDYFYACGPLSMLKAVVRDVKNRNEHVGGQLSLEERMGCGFGACMGCCIQTKKGARRVCKDGPVFDMEDLTW